LRRHELGFGDNKQCAVAFYIDWRVLCLVESCSCPGLEFTGFKNGHGPNLSHFWPGTTEKAVESRQGALDLLQPLIQAGLVKREGSKKSGRYILA